MSRLQDSEVSFETRCVDVGQVVGNHIHPLALSVGTGRGYVHSVWHCFVFVEIPVVERPILIPPGRWRFIASRVPLATSEMLLAKVSP